MKSDLIVKLKSSFPKIYSNLEEISCEDGWHDLIHTLCQKIQNYVDRQEDTQVRIFKIRSVYGSMQITAFTDGIEEVEDYIENTENSSLTVCEFTGLPGDLHCKLDKLSGQMIYHVVNKQKAQELKLAPCRLGFEQFDY